jgi:hypothetical protein
MAAAAAVNRSSWLVWQYKNERSLRIVRRPAGSLPCTWSELKKMLCLETDMSKRTRVSSNGLAGIKVECFDQSRSMQQLQDTDVMEPMHRYIVTRKPLHVSEERRRELMRTWRQQEDARLQARALEIDQEQWLRQLAACTSQAQDQQRRQQLSNISRSSGAVSKPGWHQQQQHRRRQAGGMYYNPGRAYLGIHRSSRATVQ